MGKRAAIVVAASCFVIGLLTGGLATFVWYGSKVGPIIDGALDNLSSHLQSEAYAKYRLGAYATARKALLDHAQFASGLAQRAEGVRVAMLSSAAGLSYARAAVAAERAGVLADRDRFLRLAQDAYARRGEHPSAEQLREVVLSFDREWDREAIGAPQ